MANNKKSTSKWEVTSRGEVFQRPIRSVRAVKVGEGETKETKFIINEEFWSTVKPNETSAFVNLQTVVLEKEGEEPRNSVNVVSYAEREASMTLESKISVLQQNPEIAMALATLLR